MCLTPLTSCVKNFALSVLLKSDLLTDAICTKQDNAWKEKSTIKLKVKLDPTLLKNKTSYFVDTVLFFSKLEEIKFRVRNFHFIP